VTGNSTARHFACAAFFRYYHFLTTSLSFLLCRHKRTGWAPLARARSSTYYVAAYTLPSAIPYSATLLPYHHATLPFWRHSHGPILPWQAAAMALSFLYLFSCSDAPSSLYNTYMPMDTHHCCFLTTYSVLVFFCRFSSTFIDICLRSAALRGFPYLLSAVYTTPLGVAYLRHHRQTQARLYAGHTAPRHLHHGSLTLHRQLPLAHMPARYCLPPRMRTTASPPLLWFVLCAWFGIHCSLATPFTAAYTAAPENSAGSLFHPPVRDWAQACHPTVPCLLQAICW